MKTNILMVIVLLVIGVAIIGVSVFMVKKITSTGLPEELPITSSSLPTQPTESIPTVVTKTVSAVLEGSFEKGIVWLMAQQLDDGAWPDLEGKPDVAFTALTLICVGQAPKTYSGQLEHSDLPAHHSWQYPAKAGLPHYREKYKTQIDKGVRYLLSHQRLDGSIVDLDKIPAFSTYKTPLALVALANLDKDRHADAILMARDYLEGAQYQDSKNKELYGGWGYKETGSETTPNPNMSTTNYVMDALNKAGLSQDSEVWQRALVFLQRCQDSSEYNDFRATLNSGGFFYKPTESKAGEETLPDGTKVLKPYGSMSYAGLMGFIHAYVDKDDPRVKSTYNWLRNHYTLDENPGLRTDAKPDLGKQGLFYYYHTIAKALDAYDEKIIYSLPGNKKHFWAEELVEKLGSLQKPDGTWTNEESRWWEDFAPLATAYSLMTLNICRQWVE